MQITELPGTDFISVYAFFESRLGSKKEYTEIKTVPGCRLWDKPLQRDDDEDEAADDDNDDDDNDGD